MLSNENGSVEWSVINMPFSATLSDGLMKFDYSYGGEKIRVERTGPEGEQRLYLAGTEYVFDTEASAWVLDNYQFEEGRKQYITEEYPQVPKPAIMQYQITDHLGTLAVLFSDANGDGHISSETEAAENGEDPEIIQRMLYYLPSSREPAHARKLDQHHRIPGPLHLQPQRAGDGPGVVCVWGETCPTSSGYYDAKIGRFAGMDPIAEKFAWVTGYNYAEDSPIKNIDLHGLQTYDVITNFRVTTNAGNQVNGTKVTLTNADQTNGLQVTYYYLNTDGQKVQVGSTQQDFNTSEERVAGQRLLESYNNRFQKGTGNGVDEAYTVSIFIQNIPSPSPTAIAPPTVALPVPPPPNRGTTFLANSDALTRGGQDFVSRVANDMNNNPSVNVTIWVESNLPEFDNSGNPLLIAAATIGGTNFPSNTITTRQLLVARGQAMQNALIRAGVAPARIVFALRFNSTPRVRAVYR